MEQVMQAWVERWGALMKRLEQQGARVHPLEVQPPATEAELVEVEERIGIPLPSVFRTLLQQGAKEVGMYWSLPNEAMLPDELEYTPSGDFGWSLRQLDWPYFGGDEDDLDERRYLQFHTAGNGDALLIGLDDGAADPSVWYWSHEEGEFDLMAPSFTEYVERVTSLGCIGADCGQHRQFCSEGGLDLGSSTAQIWTTWLDVFLTLTLEQSAASLESLLAYASMHGAEEQAVKDAFARFERTAVFDALQSRVEHAQQSDHKQAWSEVIVHVSATEAADWAKSLWHGNEAVPGWIRDYLTAHCLPEEEGLPLVIREVESEEADGSVHPYTALHRLRHFRSSAIISWMKPHVAFPIGGWDSLLAVSQPSAEELIVWLNGSNAERQTALHAVCRMMKQQIVPVTRIDVAEWEQVLSEWRDKEILRNNKRIFDEVISKLDDWHAS
ncbi:SMI1/KNR4 family protein [Paenibacillus sp. MER TA 81-3]|uniref:SMI1/KNR4 family protein n=1 Tax=Paenibacillus sp. MER TA 81-3 TaxID=2939573 RepID=UPI00203A8874|nr:SMI1/KNR4 family protein [Paenibacillus sp. MER TA 81-3]MCM3341854.1 SMI1/KNR4 family protein [Paenibacillus sp. MER TA 81-3]